MGLYSYQNNPSTLLGDLNDRPVAASMAREGVSYFATDTGDTYITALVDGVLIWVLAA